MRVALIGYAVENQSVYNYFSKKEDVSLTVCDKNPDVELPEGVESNLGEKYLENLDDFDLIVRSVGINPRVILEVNPSVSNKITTAVNIFFEECKTPIIGVTGTKGKGTTSTLIYKILKQAGKKSVLAGNIGTPMLDVLDEANESDFVVLELSSFQLYDLKYSPFTAVCLMVVPEHLDWHDDLEDYIGAKMNLFKHQNSDDVAIYNTLNDLSMKIASSSSSTNKLTYAVPEIGHEIPDCTVYADDDSIYFKDKEIIKISDVKLLGRHNLQNVCAAIAAVWELINGNIESIRKAIEEFSGLEYRLQFIRELKGIKYYNDSFSTTPETSVAAIKSFDQPIILILGGSDKGILFDELAYTVANSNVKHVLTIGETAPVITKLLRELDYTNISADELNNMDSIVKTASSKAESGDIVLLSTGCASFDMFKDYKDRGNQFNQAVQSLS